MLIYQYEGKWADAVAEGGGSPLWVHLTVGPLALALAAFLGWVTVYPRTAPPARRTRARCRPRCWPRFATAKSASPWSSPGPTTICWRRRRHWPDRTRPTWSSFTWSRDRRRNCTARSVDDQESRDDRQRMADMVEHLRREGLPAEGVLGYGVPPEELTRIARERGFDLLVVGTHGHRLLADMALGQTVAPILHRLTIPILVVPTRPRSR